MIIQNSFYFGLGFLAIIVAIFIYLILSTIAFFLRLGFYLLVILYFIPLIILTTILYRV